MARQKLKKCLLFPFFNGLCQFLANIIFILLLFNKYMFNGNLCIQFQYFGPLGHYKELTKIPFFPLLQQFMSINYLVFYSHCTLWVIFVLYLSVSVL